MTTSIPGYSTVAYAAATVAGGRTVVAGQAITNQGDGQVLVARYLSDGRIDPDFATDGIFRSSLPARDGPFIGTSLAVEPGTGRLLVGGGYGQGSMLALRLTPGGQLDRSFGGGDGHAVVEAGGTAQTIDLDSAGRVLLGSSNADDNGRPMVVARLTRAGVLDRSFGSGGKVESIFWNPLMASSAGVSGLVTTPGGGIVAAGHLDYIGGDGHGSAGVFALTASGQPQTGFATGGHVEVDFPKAPRGYQQWFPCALLRDAQGRLTVTGNGSRGGAGAVLSVRLTPAGALDPSFGDDGRSSVAGPSGSSDTTCGAIPAPGGGLTVGVGASVARITGAGIGDRNFGPGGRVRIISPRDVELNAATAGAGGSVVVAGSTGARLYVARWLAPTGPVARPAVAGAAAAAAAARSCRDGYHLRKKRGVLRCVRRPTEPRTPRDAVTPASIELIVASLKNGGFGATGYMRFAQKARGTAYGQWVLSNGVSRERFPFRLRINDVDYTPFTIGYPLRAYTLGKTVTATLVIGRTRSNSITVKQS